MSNNLDNSLNEARVMASPGPLTTEQIKNFRIDLDRVITIVQQSDFLRPKEQVLIKLKESRHWLGECLKELGHELPEQYRDKHEAQHIN